MNLVHVTKDGDHHGVVKDVHAGDGREATPQFVAVPVGCAVCTSVEFSELHQAGSTLAILRGRCAMCNCMQKRQEVDHCLHRAGRFAL